VGQVPRVRGERVQWAHTLGLDGLLAKHLRLGTFSDPLRGIKTMTRDQLREVIESFIVEVPAAVENGVDSLKSEGKAASAVTVQEHINTKFATEDAFVGKFATLDDFYKGPEALIGTPNPKVMQGMEDEHCRRGNSETEFTTGNYNVTTQPVLEWEFVVNPQLVEGRYPHTPKDKSKWHARCEWKGECGRDTIALEAFLEKEEVKLIVEQAGLKKAEVVALRLYTGPMFVLYNAVLRGFPEKDVKCLWDKKAGKENRYETTIFAIASGITKISKVTQLPDDRRLWRGLGGMILPKQFWELYPECQVTFAVSVSQSVADAILAKLHLEDKGDQAGAAVYDQKTKYLQLTDTDSNSGESSGALAEMAKLRLRVVKEARREGELVRMSVALPLPKDIFQREYEESFLAAMRALCGGLGGGKVLVEEVADKPQNFRGGGE
jgi:hypothetical protein